jgi:hypothetical protein
MKSGIIGLITAVLLVGCGPSALQQRACDMFSEAGGVRQDPQFPVWPNLTPEQLAHVDQAVRNDGARMMISARLAISLHEVDDLLKTCPPPPGGTK